MQALKISLDKTISYFPEPISMINVPKAEIICTETKKELPAWFLKLAIPKQSLTLSALIFTI